MAYSDKVIDHYENPRNVGTLDKNDPNVGTGLVGAPACGDVMRLQLKISDDGMIEDAKFKTFGCGSAIASSSLVTEWVKGKTVDEAMTITNKQIAKELALPPVKIHCSVLAEDAIKAAIADLKKKKGARRARRARSGSDRRQGARRRAMPMAAAARQRHAAGLRRRDQGRSCSKRCADADARRAACASGVKGGGCSGMSYVIEYCDKPRAGTRSSRWTAPGSTSTRRAYLPERHHLRFRRHLPAKGFKFVNPQVKSECGCGESFTV